MTEETWRPLGIDAVEDIAEYDALHDGIPGWMGVAYWLWVRDSLSLPFNSHVHGPFKGVDVELAEHMAQILRFPMKSLRGLQDAPSQGKARLDGAVEAMQQSGTGLQVADYLLAHGGHGCTTDLEALLDRSKSAWTVGARAGKPGLVRRVPEGVQVAADSTMREAGRAGVVLARAWEALYGLGPNPSEAYRLAIKAVEEAAVPVVSPSNASATLGTVLKQIEDQKNWSLPLKREHGHASSGDAIVSLMRMLYFGQHDRHGGQPSAPGDVSLEEATVAVSLAVTLVQLFSAGLVARSV